MKITETIKSNIHHMTKSEQKIAAYFLSNPNTFAFETLDNIAAKIDISTTSVIRFCRKLGFSGYKAFQDCVRTDFKYQLTLPEKFNRTVNSKTPNIQLPTTTQNAIRCINQTFEHINTEQISKAVNTIINAERVFCFGLKESFALAHYAYTRFLTIRSDVYILSAGQGGEIESVLSLKKNDVCIFFLFHRYTKPAPKILELLKKQGVTVILITSPPYDELEPNASILFSCCVDIKGIKNSAVAPICLIDHLCNSAIIANRDKTLNYMKKSEALFKEFIF
ncbi:MAG: MurR/RpiR family transcriptional regulator [Clostridia bacterium]|nr:MurR/RpiR family transcriptional regulator [Clostridia bacterium]